MFGALGTKVPPRASVILAIDLLLCAFSLPAALALRLGPGELAHWPEYASAVAFATPIIVVLGLVIFWMSGLYKAFWRYVSLSDIVQIGKSCALTIGAFAAILFLENRLQLIPGSVPIIQYLLLVTFMTASRLLYREVLSQLGHRVNRGTWPVPAVVIGVNATTE